MSSASSVTVCVCVLMYLSDSLPLAHLSLTQSESFPSPNLFQSLLRCTGAEFLR